MRCPARSRVPREHEPQLLLLDEPFAKGPRVTNVIGLAGSLAATSRSTALVTYVLELLAARGVPGELIELSELQANALLGRGHDRDVDAALARVAEARLLVVGTPIYRASYTGQLKAFFDLLPRAALAGCTVGLIATGGIPHHALAIDHGLRPLVASLEGLSAAHAIYATDADLETFPAGPLPTSVDAQLRALADELHPASE
jgi:FMN reductase